MATIKRLTLPNAGEDVDDRYSYLALEQCQLVYFGKLFKDFIYLFSEKGEGREKERERNSDV